MFTIQERNDSNRKTDRNVSFLFKTESDLVGQDKNVSTDIIRLLDILARIEMRRRAKKQRLTDKEKAS